jgi:hypothetical protein
MKIQASVSKGMHRNKSPQLDEEQDQALELNAGLFIWPAIMFLLTTLGLIFGYLVLGR